MRKKPLAEQVVVVAGGSYGLGRAIVREAAGRGARVVVGARGEDALEGTAAETGALVVGTDVAERAQVERLVARAVEAHGRVDSYVANAMVTVYAEADELTEEELRRVHDVDFYGAVFGYWAALPHLTESRGTFLQVSSALAYRGIPLQAAYCSSKAAGRTFFESARVELEKRGVDVAISLVLPGAINTPQFDRGRQKTGRQPQPIPPIYQPEAFARHVVDCLEHPKRELPVGWGAQKLLWGQKLSPRLGDLVLLRNGWKGQTTGQTKPVTEPDNLHSPLPGDPGARGRFSDEARSTTAWTALRRRRGWLAAGALLGLATMASQSRR